MAGNYPLVEKIRTDETRKQAFRPRPATDGLEFRLQAAPADSPRNRVNAELRTGETTSALALDRTKAKLSRMKLVSATLVYLAFAVAMGVGIVLLMSGKPALLIGATLVYFAMFAKVGCASQ